MLADVFIVNSNFMSTVFAEKPNHKAFSLLSALLVLHLWRFSGRAVLSCQGTVPQSRSIEQDA
jgi:hypothetical protein